jgi:glycosyltransferase involved in cell wall biosynthesis
MRLLVVLARPPHPEGGAADRTAVALLRGLRTNGVDVSAIAARPPSWAYGDPPPDLPVEVVEVSEGDDWHSRLHRIRRPLGALGRSVFGERVRAAAAGADAVHLETIDTAWCDDGVALPSALHLHYLARSDRPLGAPWRKSFLGAAEYVVAERLVLRRYRHLVASSPNVAAALRAAARQSDVTLAPLALDPAGYGPAPLDGPVAGIIGTASWGPTSRAVQRLLADVWMQVRERAPGARLRVAGRGFAGLSGVPEGVEVVGEVASAAEFLRSLSLLLYPLDAGTGMKVKTMEALAAGVPVVTTPAGAEGIAPSPGLIVASTSNELAAAAAALLQDPAERRRRGAAGRTAFLQHHTPELATRPLVELYERLVSAPAHSVSSSR